MNKKYIFSVAFLAFAITACALKSTDNTEATTNRNAGVTAPTSKAPSGCVLYYYFPDGTEELAINAKYKILELTTGAVLGEGTSDENGLANEELCGKLSSGVRIVASYKMGGYKTEAAESGDKLSENGLGEEWDGTLINCDSPPKTAKPTPLNTDMTPVAKGGEPFLLDEFDLQSILPNHVSKSICKFQNEVCHRNTTVGDFAKRLRINNFRVSVDPACPGQAQMASIPDPGAVETESSASLFAVRNCLAKRLESLSISMSASPDNPISVSFRIWDYSQQDWEENATLLDTTLLDAAIRLGNDPHNKLPQKLLNSPVVSADITYTFPEDVSSPRGIKVGDSAKKVLSSFPRENDTDVLYRWGTFYGQEGSVSGRINRLFSNNTLPQDISYQIIYSDIRFSLLGHRSETVTFSIGKDNTVILIQYTISIESATRFQAL